MNPQHKNFILSLSSKVTKSWITTTIFRFVFFIILLGASVGWMDLVLAYYDNLSVIVLLYIYQIALSQNILFSFIVFIGWRQNQIDTSIHKKTFLTIPKNTITTPLNFTLQCSLDKNITTQTCPASYPEKWNPKGDPETCPDYFRWIHKDLERRQKELSSLQANHKRRKSVCASIHEIIPDKRCFHNMGNIAASKDVSSSA